MHTFLRSSSAAIVALGMLHSGAAFAGDPMVNLAGTADGDSRFTEFNLTAGYGQIDRGDGSAGDADAIYSIADDSLLGTSVDLFPNEQAFGLGDLSYNSTGVTGIGTETFAVTDIDLAALYTAGSSTSDISDSALGLFLFDAPRSLSFGPLDADDTVTFVNGELASIDIAIDAVFAIDLTFSGASFTEFDGRFSISGNRFALDIDDTEFDVPSLFGTLPQSRIVFDIRGTVDSVVPAPGTAALALFAGIAANRRRRATA